MTSSAWFPWLLWSPLWSSLGVGLAVLSRRRWLRRMRRAMPQPPRRHRLLSPRSLIWAVCISLSLTTLSPSTTGTAQATVNDGSYEDFLPCVADELDPLSGPQTLEEWAACSAAYNTDRARTEALLTSFLGLMLLTAIVLILASSRMT